MGPESCWQALVENGELDGSALPKVNGRIDLRGTKIAKTTIGRKVEVLGNNISELRGQTVIRGGHWKGIDFSGSDLRELRFFDSTIDDCSFDGARCQGWRLWRTSISRTTFRETDLRKSVLGAISDRKLNSFVDVEFLKTDLRQTVYIAALMRRCKFEMARLESINFQGTVFEDCWFTGPMDNVVFNRYAFRQENLPPNEMKDVDLSLAQLRCVQFRRLDMNSVKWPGDSTLLILRGYKDILDRLMSLLAERSDEPSRRAASWLEIERRWAGPNQEVGMLNTADLRDVSNESVVAEVVRVCEDARIRTG